MFERIPPDSIEELRKRNLSVECPHCQSDIIAEPVSEPVNQGEYTYFIALCPHHKDYSRFCKPFFCVYQPMNNCITDKFPLSSHEWGNYHKSIPDSVRKDYAESHKCFSVGAYKGSVALCRRIIEAICHNKLGEKIKDLEYEEKTPYKLIDELKESGLITENLRSTAHEIRHLGNYGVHFQNDGLEEVSFDEAKEILGFTNHLLNELYIIPYKTSEMKIKRTKK